MQLLSGLVARMASFPSRRYQSVKLQACGDTHLAGAMIAILPYVRTSKSMSQVVMSTARGSPTATIQYYVTNLTMYKSAKNTQRFHIYRGTRKRIQLSAQRENMGARWLNG